MTVAGEPSALTPILLTVTVEPELSTWITRMPRSVEVFKIGYWVSERFTVSPPSSNCELTWNTPARAGRDGSTESFPPKYTGKIPGPVTFAYVCMFEPLPVGTTNQLDSCDGWDAGSSVIACGIAFFTADV